MHAYESLYGASLGMTLITMALPILKLLIGRNVRIRMVVHGGEGADYLRNLNVYGLYASRI